MSAPIVVFGYNRPDHLKRCLKAIEANVEATNTSVYIFIDGPKPGFENLQKYQKCTEIAEKNYNFGSKKVFGRESNLGLANSIRLGLDFIFQDHQEVIVIEDDIILAPTALKFLNQGLKRYVDNPQVSSIHSYQYPINIPLEECVALRGADCWGWATWKDRWISTSFDGQGLLTQLQNENLIHDFDLDGKIDYADMLEKQIRGEIDSWAICWHASMFLQDRYCIYPPNSLSLNIGSDGSGVHSGTVDIFLTSLSTDSVWVFPEKVTQNVEFRKSLMNFYMANKPRRGLLSRFLHKMIRNLGVRID